MPSRWKHKGKLSQIHSTVPRSSFISVLDLMQTSKYNAVSVINKLSGKQAELMTRSNVQNVIIYKMKTFTINNTLICAAFD